MEDEGERVNLGKSILVPSVQELAKHRLKGLPERYARISGAHNDNHNDDELQVPIINMEALISEDGVELHKLHSSCQNWGFFQLINHGVSNSLVEKFKVETEQFFNLPMEEKKKYWQTPTNLEGFGQAFVFSEEQKLDWADMFFMTTFPTHFRNPSLFPMLPLLYRNTMEDYTAEIRKLSGKILDFMAKALNIDTNINRFGEVGHQTIRMNYYPPCPEPEKAIGLTPHTDSGSLITILLQLNETQGLQICHDNKWVAISPLPQAFVINVGDVLEIMTNGIYKSVLHQAAVNATKERMSVAIFHAPALDHEIGPVPDLVTSTNPAKFKRISMADYWKHFLARPLDGEKVINMLKIVS